MTEQQTYIHPDMDDEDEIDLLKLAKTFWSGRKTFFICILVGAVLGVFVAVLTPAEYTATTIMVPQSTGKSSSMGSLGGLAALAGIDISGASQGGDMSPILYPKIVSSIPFKLELMNTPIKFKEFEKPISLFEYSTNPIYSHISILGFVKKYTIGLPGVIIGAIKGKKTEISFSKDERGQLIVLSDDQNKVSKALDNLISLEVEPKQGYLTLSVVMPEALAAAQLAQKAQELLQRDITRFKVQKAKADLEFIQERYNEVKAEAEGYQINIAQRTDQYKSLTSVVPQVQTTRIQTKYGIASTVFQELAKQLEQAKIQVKKDTPIFTIVEPVSVPNEKSKPSRPLILIIWIFFGAIVGVIIIFGKHNLKEIKQNWNS
jgi:LPS O-antigen subunit length determinant protein (WzzB/FepE family)